MSEIRVFNKNSRTFTLSEASYRRFKALGGSFEYGYRHKDGSHHCVGLVKEPLGFFGNDPDFLIAPDEDDPSYADQAEE